jgi:hypothetical protein
MEVHSTPERDMDHFIKECARFFHDKQSRGHLSLSFCIQFFKQHVILFFQCVLAFVIERNIVLVDNVSSKPPITIKFHNLHVGDIIGAMGEIVSYNKRD